MENLIKVGYLQLKHIALYFEHRLKVVDITDGHIFTVVSLYDDSFSVYSDTETSRIIYFNWNNYPTFKLLLRPLTSLLNPEFRQIAHDLGADIDYEAAVYDIQRGWTKQHLYEKLIQNHFDVSGLIDAGLAIDIEPL